MSFLDWFGLMTKTEAAKCVQVYKDEATKWRDLAENLEVANGRLSEGLSAKTAESDRRKDEIAFLEGKYNDEKKTADDLYAQLKSPRYFADVEKNEARKQVFLYVQSMNGSERVYLQALVYNNKNKVKLANTARNLNRLFGHKDA